MKALARHPQQVARLRGAIELFDLVAKSRDYFIDITYDPTTAVFELTQQELDEGDPFAWPHHYRVILVHDMGAWKSKVVDESRPDLIGMINALREGIELDVSDAAMTDWLIARMS